ncbi:hypothetical protein F0L17_14515 [Streptomyces sp. TRM43335]|uniref:Uncharacterized protein n=1 Tax=Streptomyces taklimakanensis TaxID=2569853 RepID=A0A6G2BDH9_9ACTN|nr:hypothetical protein [Streptomyces taklimakanensis]MTE20300.1 hypothetical protein [Streptomyces taklimakanensis]
MPASKAQRAATAERRSKAIAMRIGGADWQTIADALDYSDRAAAHKDVTRALEANRKAEAAQVEEMRDIETQRLDRLQAAFWPKALKGDTKAAEIVRRCIMDRAKLQGTTTPEKVEHTGGLRYEIVGVDPNDLA